jgi:hypothetical protein
MFLLKPLKIYICHVYIQCDNIVSSQNGNSHNRYKPDPKIEQFMRDRIIFNRILGQKKRYELSAKEENLGTKLRQDKKRLLDNVIFPSLANLILFFKYMEDNDELRDLFEKDIEELLDIKQNIIGHFISSILTWDMKKYPHNFRLGLIVEIQQILFDKVVISMSGSIFDKKKMTILSQTIENDMGRALSWTQFWYNKNFVEKEE